MRLTVVPKSSPELLQAFSIRLTLLLWKRAANAAAG